MKKLFLALTALLAVTAVSCEKNSTDTLPELKYNQVMINGYVMDIPESSISLWVPQSEYNEDLKEVVTEVQMHINAEDNTGGEKRNISIDVMGFYVPETDLTQPHERSAYTDISINYSDKSGEKYYKQYSETRTFYNIGDESGEGPVFKSGTMKVQYKEGTCYIQLNGTLKDGSTVAAMIKGKNNGPR